MADASRGGSALGWVVLGFLAGVAATMAIFTVLSPSHARHREPSEVLSAAPAPRLSEDAAPKPQSEPAPSAAPAPALAAANAVDQQVQEDAAAAGMTSRRTPLTASAPPAVN